MRKLLSFLMLVVLFTGCKKSELEQVPNNVPPPDGTITNITIENYITRTYILTLGREPSPVEFDSAKSWLTTSNLDSASRQKFLNEIFIDSDFRPHVYDETRNTLLNNTDTADFSNWIYIFDLFLNDTTYTTQWPYFQYEKDRMVALRESYSDYVNGSIEIDELQRRMCNNYLYDQINMGSANFVISTFQNLINRNPTIAEQSAGISMIDGNSAVLFLQSGNSKDDYLNIFTDSNNYYEGQVVFMYIKYLNRQPDTIEMSDGTLKYSTTTDYTAVQRVILAMDEFIGI